MTQVLVTGVRGTTGVELARSLAARPDVVLRGGSSRPETVSLPGVVPTAFSWDEPAGWGPALEGSDAVFVVRPDRADAPERIADLLDRTAAGTRVVLLSERVADRVGPDGWAVRAEAAVRASGHPWTLLRPSWFMQVLVDERFFRRAVLEDATLPFSSGGARVAWIDARDIAAVAGRALLEPGHEGRTYELTGPEALSLPRTAELLARTTGLPVTHRELTVDQSAEGLQGFERSLTRLTSERVRAGHFADVTDTVAQLTGRPPRALEAFLAEALGRG